MIQFNKFVLRIFIFVFFFFSPLYSLNTSNPRGSNTVYALGFQENYNASSTVWGFVSYQEGFSVNSTVTLQLGIASPVKGGEINLANGSVIELLTDLVFGSTIRLTIGSSSGDTAYIIGNSGALMCDGNLSIPDNRNIRFINSDIVIDGNGNYFNLGQGSQLIVDSNITLTLRNLILTGLKGNADGVGGIVFTDNSAGLALQNVIIELEDDYDCSLGWLYFHDDVILRGDSYKFRRSSIYDYPNQKPTIIDKYSNVLFDLGIIFEYDYRSSITEQCRDNLIFKDESSVLIFNGSVFSVPAGSSTYAGVFLRDGTLILDNKVTFSNYSGQFINTDPKKGIIFGNVQDDVGGVTLNLKVTSDARAEVLGSLVVNNGPWL